MSRQILNHKLKKSSIQYFADVLNKANQFLTLSIVKKSTSRHIHREFVRHLSLAQQWVKFADLSKCEDPKTTIKKIDLDLLSSILDLSGFISMNEFENLKKHIVNTYGESHIQKSKESSVLPIHKMFFEHSDSWNDFLLKIKFFNESEQEWNFFEYLFNLKKGTLKIPLVSFEENTFAVYSFANKKETRKISFTIYENSIKVETVETSKGYSESYEKVEKFTTPNYRYNKTFNLMVSNFVDVLGGI